MTPAVEKAMNTAHEARGLFRKGQISHAEASKLIQPYLSLVNEGAKKLSAQYGNPFRKVTLTGFLR